MTYTTTVTRHPKATLWVHVEGEAAHEATEEDLEAFGIVLPEPKATPGGPYCAHCGGQHLGVECRMRAAGQERDLAREHARELEAMLAANPTGSDDRDAATIGRLVASLTAEEDMARHATEILIAEFGANGPMDVDEAAERAVRVARQRADGLAQAVTDATAEVIERVCAAVRVVGGTLVVGDMYFVGFGYVTDKHAECIRDEIRKAAKG